MNALPFFMYFLVSQDLSRKLDPCENVTSGATGFCLPEEFCAVTAKGNNIGPCENEEVTDICCRIVYSFNGTERSPQTFTITKISLPTGDGIEKESRTVSNANRSTIHPGIRRFVDRHITDKMRRLTEIFRTVSSLRNVPGRDDASQETRMESTESIIDLGNSDSEHRSKKSLDIDPMHLGKKSSEIYSIDEMKSAVKDLMHNGRKPVQTDKTHNMRKAVEIDPTHDGRKPVETDPAHDMRKPVQIDPSHNKPTETDPTHNMRKTVQTDPTHSMRRTVHTDESHDLRWPVTEEETHDLRNPFPEFDMLQRQLIETEILKFINAFKEIEAISDILRNNTYRNVHISEDYIKCVTHYSNINMTSANCTLFQQESFRHQWSFIDMIDSTSVCGRPYNRQNIETDGSASKWPWMVSLQEWFYDAYWHKCGASILNNLWVITAAHCVDHQRKEEFILWLGTKETEFVPHQTVHKYLDRIVIHPMFNRATLEHDIALIRMKSPLVFQSNISPICMFTGVEKVDDNSAVALGWGHLMTEKSVSSYSLNELPVNLLQNHECDAHLKSEKFGTNFVCAKAKEGYDFCDGDSGGPLAILNNEGRWSLIGIVSWSDTCSSSPSNHTRVYTRISEYVQWIENMIFCFEKVI